MTNTNETKEHFSFIVKTKTSSLSVGELLSYLSNYETLVKSVNHVMNNHGGCGYDQVYVEVEAFNHGSFEIRGFLRKVTQNPTFSAVSAGIIASLVTKALNSDQTPTNVLINEGGVVVINYSDLIENKEILKARSRIAKTAIFNDEVKSLITEYQQDNVPIKTEINIESLNALIINEDETDEDIIEHIRSAKLRIIAPVLESEPANWKFKMGNKKISARMADEEFLQEMNKTKIAFGKGDDIVVDIDKITKSDNSTRPRYVVTKVYSYPRYKIENDTQMSLFK